MQKDEYIEETKNNLVEKESMNQIKIDCIINNIFSKVTYTQVYENTTHDIIELLLHIPYSHKIILKKISVKIGNFHLKSKVVFNEEEEESDEIIGLLGHPKEYNREVYEVYVGKLILGERIEIQTEFLKPTTIFDLSYEFKLNLYNMPNLVEMKIKSFDKTCGGNCRLFYFYNILAQEKKFFSEITFNAKISLHPNQIRRVCIKDYDIIPILENNNKEEAIINIDDNTFKKFHYKSIHVLFKENNVDEYPNTFHNFYYWEFNKNHYDYVYTFSYNFTKQIKFEENNLDNYSIDTDNKKSYTELYDPKNLYFNSPGYFFLLIDLNNQMLGKSFDIAIYTLKLLTLSLPEGSYFNIIGFSSKYNCVFPNPVKYSSQTLELALKRINNFSPCKSPKLSDLTNVLDIVFNKTIFLENLPKNIIILNQGLLSNPNTVLNLINQNAKSIRTHIISLAFESKKFIKEAKYKGRGFSAVATEVNDFPTLAITALNLASRPCYNDIKSSFNWNIKCNEITKNFSEVKYPSTLGNLCYGEQMHQFYFVNIKLSGLFSININEIEGYPAVDQNYNLGQNIKFKEENDVHIIAVFNEINRESYFEKSQKNLIDLAVNYQILYHNTEMFLEADNNQSTEDKDKFFLVKITPSLINDIMKNTNTSNLKVEEKIKTNNKKKDENRIDFEALLFLASIEGIWKYNSHNVLKQLLLLYDKKLENLKIYLDEMKMCNLDIMITIVVLHYFNTKYQERKKEIILIENKSKMKLEKLKIDYDDVISLLS